MKRYLKGTAVAAAGLLALGATEAKADAIGYSQFLITGAQVFNNGTGAPLTGAEFGLLNISNRTNASANLNGSGVSLQAPTDVPLQCLGDCAGIGQNNFNRVTDGGVAPDITPSMSRGDALLTGTLLGGVGANASTVAEGWVTGTDTASSTGQTNNFTVFNFSLPTAVDVRFDFSADVNLFSSLFNSTALLGQTASAGISFVIEVTNLGTGATAFRWAPNGLTGGIEGGNELADPFSLNQSRTALLTPQTLTFDSDDAGDNPGGSEFFSAVATGLTPGTNYSLTIEQISTVELESVVTQIPEPGTLGLLGGSLAALGAVGIRRRRRAADAA